jgi:hypothetical protein
MKTNTRGDSGLSDSGLQRSHKFYRNKHKDVLDKIRMCGKIEMRRRQAKSANRGLWNRIRSWFSK